MADREKTDEREGERDCIELSGTCKVQYPNLYPYPLPCWLRPSTPAE